MSSGAFIVVPALDSGATFFAEPSYIDEGRTHEIQIVASPGVGSHDPPTTDHRARRAHAAGSKGCRREIRLQAADGNVKPDPTRSKQDRIRWPIALPLATFHPGRRVWRVGAARDKGGAGRVGERR